MKHARFSLLALPMLIAAGCQVPKLPTVKPTATIDKSAWPGSPSVAAYTYADKWTDAKGIERCNYVLTYPELVRPHVWDPEEEVKTDPVLDRANHEIMRAYGLMSPTGTTELTPEEVAGEFIDLCKSDIIDMSQELGPESVTGMSYVDDSTFTVHLLTPSIASLTIESYSFLGGAHGNPSIQAVTLDLATGARLKVADVIKADQIDSVMQRVYTEVLRTYEDALFEAAATSFNAVVNTKEPLSADEHNEFAESTGFFLSGDGIIFFWNTYEITPYVAGQPMVMIPWSELEGKLLINPR
jgi:hypothetical protein